MSENTEYKGCNYCKHFRYDGGCPAFDPDPIPIDIVSGQTKHTLPIFGQKTLLPMKIVKNQFFRGLWMKKSKKKL